MIDQYGRNIDYMRISVTDRCNFRCAYCMPPEGTWLMEHGEILRFEEILEIVRIASELGIENIRVTGGELFVRKGILPFLEELTELPGIKTVSITTNGSMLEEYLAELKRMGIAGINVSLDTVDREHFCRITGRDELPWVLRGIRKAAEMDFPHLKVNCVPIRGWNEKELCQVAGLARDYPLDVRFIELMPVGLGRKMKRMSQAEVVELLEEQYGALAFETENGQSPRGRGPAVYGHLQGFRGSIGFISALSHEFCASCSRLRLLADGGLKACLNYESSVNLRDLLREGASREEVKRIMAQVIWNKPARHGFEKTDTERESHLMSSIGG